MTPETWVWFLSILALFAQVAIVGLVVALAFPSALREWVRAQVAPNARMLVAMVSGVATAGSLYLSEGAGYVPCKLCWYQRIAMYPIAVVSIAALVARRRDVGLYAATLAGLGAPISIYHMVLERFPELESSVCDPNTPCTIIWTERLGYLTIPTMALSAFVLILTLLVTERNLTAKET